MPKHSKLHNLQIQTMLIVSGFLVLAAFGVGTINYLEHNSFSAVNTARAADDTNATVPVNPGGGGVDLPKGNTATGTSTSTSATTSSTASSTSSTTSASTSTSTSSPVNNPDAATENKTPINLPGGESDVLVINKDKTITSQTTQPTTNQTPTPVTAKIDTTVRTGGLEVTLATIGGLFIVAFIYFYKKRTDQKSSLKTAEKKIHSK